MKSTPGISASWAELKGALLLDICGTATPVLPALMLHIVN